MNDLLDFLQLQTKIIPIAGGDINQTYRVTDGQQNYFLKYHPQVSGDFFYSRSRWLKRIEQCCACSQSLSTWQF